jgi:hypothetical protein
VNGGEQLLFIADGAVGQEHHLAQVVRAGRLPERHGQRRAHVGPALGGEAGHIGAGAPQIGVTGGPRRGEQRLGLVVEADDVEAVFRIEPVERQEERPLGLGDRGAVHGPRGVHDQD